MARRRRKTKSRHRITYKRCMKKKMHTHGLKQSHKLCRKYKKKR
jgi:hypothetical protein